MQRLIEATLIKNILEKYQNRYDECQAQWDKDCQELKDNIINAGMLALMLVSQMDYYNEQCLLFLFLSFLFFIIQFQ